MKSKKLILSAILMVVSSTVMAQENIQKAFDALRQSKGQEETYTNHFMERDPDTYITRCGKWQQRRWYRRDEGFEVDLCLFPGF